MSDGVFRELKRYSEANPYLEKWLYASAFEHLAQGDIIKALPACYINKDGEVKRTKVPLPAILLSNTCDMSKDCGKIRKPSYTIVPLLPFSEEEFGGSKLQSIKDNTVTDVLFLPNVPTLSGSYIAQLDTACSVSSEYIHKHVGSNRTSLTRNGYYFFMAKLSLHLTRPENDVERCDT
ncbi:MAG: hypothetical protein Q9M16_06910 [Mariprofundus sp.]|nr:hypothetical protein [Mariprofundus sp.]